MPIASKIVTTFLKSLKGKVPTTLAEEEAAEVIRIVSTARKEGRELTDSELSSAEASFRDADFNYLLNNYDLPMGKLDRMERAKQIGFDLNNLFYRGNQSNIGNVNLHTGPIFGSRDPALAHTYGEDVMEFVLRPQKTTKGEIIPTTIIEADKQKWAHMDPETKVFPEDAEYSSEPKLNIEEYFGPNTSKFPTNADEIGISTEDIVRMASPGEVPSKTFEFRDIYDIGSDRTGLYKVQRFLRDLKSKGQIKDKITGYGGIYEVSVPKTNIAIVGQPERIRQTRAIFDPLLKNVSNTLAGVAPIGALPFITGGQTVE